MSDTWVVYWMHCLQEFEEMVSALEAERHKLLREIEKLRPVVEAANEWIEWKQLLIKEGRELSRSELILFNAIKESRK